MRIACSILFICRLSKTLVKDYVTTKFLYRVWHLNNVRAPLVAISLCQSQRSVNSVVKSVVELSFFISPPSVSRFQNEQIFSGQRDERKYADVKIFEVISDNGFINRNSCFFKERIQIICIKQLVNIETYLQFLDYRKNSELIHLHILFGLC